ncbi:MAG: hypothetical protein ACRCUE_10260 [Bosea sp. (in: a-proteobacteria)]
MIALRGFLRLKPCQPQGRRIPQDRGLASVATLHQNLIQTRPAANGAGFLF